MSNFGNIVRWDAERGFGFIAVQDSEKDVFCHHSVVVGNPGTVVKRRFEDDVIAQLLDIAWWNWPIEHITRHIPAIVGGDLARLQAAKDEL